MDGAKSLLNPFSTFYFSLSTFLTTSGEKPSLSWPNLSFEALLGEDGFGIATTRTNDWVFLF